MEASVWDVTELRRLLCWARENEQRQIDKPLETEPQFSEADTIRAKSLGVIL